MKTWAMRKISIGVVLFLLLHNSRELVIAAESLRVASGGFTTAIHAVLWGAYEEKIFKKYSLEVEYLALNTGRLGHANAAIRRCPGAFLDRCDRRNDQLTKGGPSDHSRRVEFFS